MKKLEKEEFPEEADNFHHGWGSIFAKHQEDRKNKMKEINKKSLPKKTEKK